MGIGRRVTGGGAVTRLRGYAGLWTLVALFSLVIVFVAAAAGPTTREIESRALRQLLADAPPPARDITVTEPALHYETTAERMHAGMAALLAPALADAVGGGWGIQRTRISQPQLAASVNGEGIDTSGPAGFMPLATLHHQTDLLTEVGITTGRAPRSGPGGIEVVASAAVAGELGLRVGQAYHLLPGVAARSPLSAEEVSGPVVAFTLVGVFEPVDPTGPVWEFDQWLLRPGVVQWSVSGDLVPLRRATLVTDQAGIDLLTEGGLTDLLGVENVARFSLDTTRLDAGWPGPAADAVAELLSDPSLRPAMRVQTGLLDLLDEFRRQAAAARALAAVVTAGLIGIGVGLLVLAARLTLSRRRDEVSLLRARGASGARMVGRFLAETAIVVIPAAVVGWLLHLLLFGRTGLEPPVGVDAAPVAVAVVALLAVPATVAVELYRRSGTRLANRSRRELRRYRSAPARITAELAVVVLAGLGVLLLHRRGLTTTGTTDPYLSAVPVLVAVAAGLLALRLVPGPLRALGAVTARRRGAVGFIGLARAGRAAPVSALSLLVLVAAVAVGGFAGAVYGSVTAARDAAAGQAVGADARVRGEGLTGESVAAVAALPGVEAVAVVRHGGFVRADGRRLQEVVVVSVDTAAYQRILPAIEAPTGLPDAVVPAEAGVEPVPILADRRLAARGGGLTVEVDEVELPAEVVGDVAGLPDLAGSDRWVLVPWQALPGPVAIDELLISGPAIDPDALREAAGGGSAVEVTTLAGHRAALAASGFNQGLTMVFVVGTAGGALGGLLAIGLALVVQATDRGRALSLLRTMGLSPSQARGVLLVELVPVAALAVLVGAAAGTAMPVLLAPALGLGEFTGGAPIPVGLDLRTIAVLAGLLGLFVIGGALVEAAVNRRRGLGHVLRVD